MLGGRTKLLGFVVTLVFLALVLWKTDLSELATAFRSANYLYVIPASLCRPPRQQPRRRGSPSRRCRCRRRPR